MREETCLQVVCRALYMCCGRRSLSSLQRRGRSCGCRANTDPMQRSGPTEASFSELGEAKVQRSVETRHQDGEKQL